MDGLMVDSAFLFGDRVTAMLPGEVDKAHSYIFLEEEASSCPDPLRESVKDETQRMHYCHR
jgi:hypothetical protein